MTFSCSLRQQFSYKPHIPAHDLDKYKLMVMSWQVMWSFRKTDGARFPVDQRQIDFKNDDRRVLLHRGENRYNSTRLISALKRGCNEAEVEE